MIFSKKSYALLCHREPFCLVVFNQKVSEKIGFNRAQKEIALKMLQEQVPLKNIWELKPD